MGNLKLEEKIAGIKTGSKNKGNYNWQKKIMGVKTGREK